LQSEQFEARLAMAETAWQQAREERAALEDVVNAMLHADRVRCRCRLKQRRRLRHVHYRRSCRRCGGHTRAGIPVPSVTQCSPKQLPVNTRCCGRADVFARLCDHSAVTHDRPAQRRHDANGAYATHSRSAAALQQRMRRLQFSNADERVIACERLLSMREADLAQLRADKQKLVRERVGAHSARFVNQCRRTFAQAHAHGGCPRCFALERKRC
jgi:hypothetical protein